MPGNRPTGTRERIFLNLCSQDKKVGGGLRVGLGFITAHHGSSSVMEGVSSAGEIESKEFPELSSPFCDLNRTL